jgi:hypothetical protein
MPKISKLSIMELLSKNFTSYVSTQWLKTEVEGTHKCPSDMMKDGEFEQVYKILQKQIKVKKCK